MSVSVHGVRDQKAEDEYGAREREREREERERGVVSSKRESSRPGARVWTTYWDWTDSGGWDMRLWADIRTNERRTDTNNEQRLGDVADGRQG